MTDQDPIPFPGAAGDGLLEGAQRRAAMARTAADWMEIYIEIVGAQLAKIEKMHDVAGGARHVYDGWVSTARPRLQRIGRAFTQAGLVLDERMEVSGCDPSSGQLVWAVPGMPKVTFHWPDGSTLSFEGDEASSAMGFFVWWANFQLPVIGAEGAGERRIIEPGSPEHTRYMAAKRQDQSRGVEPT